MKFKYTGIFVLALLFVSANGYSQKDVMMQAFYWNVPADVVNKNGSWWVTLQNQADELKEAGFTGLWVPPPSKGTFGIYDMGYGLYDHYDLGSYNQRGTTETRFGSKTELINFMKAAHTPITGTYVDPVTKEEERIEIFPGMEVYMDAVLNHVYTGPSSTNINFSRFAFDDYIDNQAGDPSYSANADLEVNPVVKNYFNTLNNTPGNRPYPTNEAVWKITNAVAGDYYIQIKGYPFADNSADWNGDLKKRTYRVYMNWTGTTPDYNTKYSTDDPEAQPAGTINWESEPNNGSGSNNNFPVSGQFLYAHMEDANDVDEYHINVAAGATIEIRIKSIYNDQANACYYPFAIYRNGQPTNLFTTELQCLTWTGISYDLVNKNQGEPNLDWNYTHFHPVDGNDYLAGFTANDDYIPNTKFFGSDLNTFDVSAGGVVDRLKDWGKWLSTDISNNKADPIAFDGFRLDFVRGFYPEFVANWVSNLPSLNGKQRFIVGEYFTGDPYWIKNWVNGVANPQVGVGADVDGFDFPLKFTLNNMTNGNGSSFKMYDLNHAGLVRNNGGNELSGTSVVTFVENHDTGKEHDKWVTKDWAMAYSYILFAEGRPCVFYPQYYGVTQIDNNDNAITITPNTTSPGFATLQDEINRMIFNRETFLDGGMVVLTEIGNPTDGKPEDLPKADGYDVTYGTTDNVYIARREGNKDTYKQGAILCINNHDSQALGMWVDNNPAGYFSDYTGATLMEVSGNTNQTTNVSPNDGRVFVWAPPRSYTVWTPNSSKIPPKFPKMNGTGLNIQNNGINTFVLNKNYPNPFNPTTQISFNLPSDGNVAVKVFNMMGQEVSVLYNGAMNAGDNHATWNAAGFSSGVYMYSVEFNGITKTGKMILAK